MICSNRFEVRRRGRVMSSAVGAQSRGFVSRSRSGTLRVPIGDRSPAAAGGQPWLTGLLCQPKVTVVSDTTQLASDASSQDPAVGLRAVRALRVLIERLEALQVDNARDQNWSWQEIAVCLGVTRQAVHKKYAGGRGLLRGEK